MGIADSPLRDRLIFNVGARRSGTFWLQRVVTAHPVVAEVPSETSLFSHGIAPLMDRFHHGARSSPQVGALYIRRELLCDAVRDFTDTVLGQYLEPGATRLAERTALHVHHVGLIADVYPDAHVVHIVRDGRDVARSVKVHPWGPSTIAGAATEWRDAILDARAANLPPERYREIRYETLLETPETAIPELYDWLGLPCSTDIVERALAEARTQKNVDEFAMPGVAAGKWQNASTKRDLADFEGVAGDLLDNLGYPAGELARAPVPLGARAVVQRVRRARTRVAASPEPPRTGEGPLDHVVLGDRILGALLERRFDTLTPLLASNALVKITTASGVTAERGEAGRRLLEAALSVDDDLSGYQAVGDVYPGKPTLGYVLSFERDGRPGSDRILFVTLRDGRVVELALYAPPLRAPAEPGEPDERLARGHDGSDPGA